MPHAPNTFIHLHNHTEYSLLDGASRIPTLVARAAELEMPALAMTDHGVMYGAIHFYKACKDAGIKPIIGCEVYVAPRSRLLREGRVDRDPNHLTLLAAGPDGYLNLMKLCTVGQMEGMYYKPRIDKEILAEHSKGLIALSGCLQGEAASRITDGDIDGARESVAAYRDIFGKDGFLLEVQRHGIDRQDAVNEALTGFGKEFGLRLCATNDLHYVHRRDSEAHDVLLCLQTGARFNDPNRWRFSSQENYLKTAEEMRAAFADLPDALASTLDVADMVDLKLKLGATLLPPFDVPDEMKPDQYLRKLVLDGLQWRYGEPNEVVKERAETELSVISQTGYASYFLIVWDFYNFARKEGIVVGPGRGSAAGSLVSYCLGITNLDPIQHGLIFERFLNIDRVSMPDIDCDFSVEGREKVIRYVSEKYGSDRVAQIITFTTMASKAAIRDVGRVLEVPLRDTDRLAKLVPVWQGRSKTLDDTIKEVAEFREAYESNEEQKRLIDVARTLEGVSRNVSTHAAGVVIAPEPLVRYAPLQYGPGREAVVTQYDMKAVGDIGLLKIDFLGLQNLDIMATCMRLVKEHRGLEIDLEHLPFDDAKYLAQVGAPATFGEPGYSTLERQWTRPTLEVNGMWGGYEGPGEKTVIPSEAHAKITCRLVADQHPDEVLAVVRRHLESHLPPGTRLSIAPGDHGARPAEIAADHFALEAADTALREVYGVRPLIVRSGGTVPISELFQRHMGLDTVFFSFSTADEDYHAPNEFFRVHRLHEGLEAWARYWTILGERRS